MLALRKQWTSPPIVVLHGHPSDPVQMDNESRRKTLVLKVETRGETLLGVSASGTSGDKSGSHIKQKRLTITSIYQ